MTRTKFTLPLAVLLLFGCQKDDAFESEEREKNLTMAVFGGSYSVIPESEIAKNIWKEEMNITITDYY